MSGFAVEINFKATPGAFFPFLSAGESKYEAAGGGAFIDTGITLFNWLNVGPEFGLQILPKNNIGGLEEDAVPIVLIVPVGLQVGAVFYPFSRIQMGMGIAAGPYGLFTNEKSHYAPWYRAYADVDFRINTKLSVGFDVSWFNCQYNTYWGNPGAAGLTAGVGINFKLDTKKSSGKIEATVDYPESVFPLLYTIYKDNPIGTITINNNETAEIRNVVVKFRSEGYTASELECGRIKMIHKHRSENLDFIADLNDKILRFSESGQISGELVVEYELLGDKRTSVIPVTVPVYNRNSVRWFDATMISSFVSTNSQEILEFSKYIVGVARNHVRSGLNRNLQFAMYVFEGISSSGIAYEDTSDTPYDTVHLDPQILDYVQYPYQTLAYRSGDKDDVGILFMSMLESVGISAAYIPTEDDFIVAVQLGDDTNSIRNMFDGDERILSIDDKIWVPLAMSQVDNGFINSWAKAVGLINSAIENDEDIDFIILSDAWQMYPPSNFSTGESNVKMPSERTLAATVDNVLSQYINQEFGPKITDVLTRIKTEGASTDLYNQLGMLYVRAGLYPNAMAVYEVSAKMGSISAMNNLGNLCTLQNDYNGAMEWYKKVLEIDPENGTAIKNIEKIAAELEN
ncbi:MAG: tetratricopeptide repeat protein [Treponema sp.]|nr:tetratricopeptide repeat protein [Treponema sp.]